MAEKERNYQLKLAYAALMKFYPLSLEDLPDEQWCAIAGYEHYQISTFGRVKSFWFSKPKILKPALHTSGYLIVHLYVNEKRTAAYIHRLVAETFLLNPHDKFIINHIDGCKMNNFVENLEWCTAAENMLHASEFGLMQSGEAHYNMKLTDKQILFIRANPDKLIRVQLAKKFGVAPQTIWNIVNS